MAMRLLIVVLAISWCGCQALESFCVDPAKTAICRIEGKTIDTFDGMKFEYEICNHILAQNRFNNRWSIEEVRLCEEGKKCSKSLFIRQGTRVLQLTADLRVKYGGYTYTIAQANMIGSLLQAFSVHQNSNNQVYFKSLLNGFWITFDVRGSIRIGITGELSNKVYGLCGMFNGKPDDDTTKPDGSTTSLVHLFGDSWRVPGSLVCKPSECTNRPHIESFCSNFINSTSLNACKDVVNMEFCMETCVADICSCLENYNLQTCRCLAAERFMKSCKVLAPTLNLSLWRTETNCYSECGKNMMYYDCYNRQCEPSCSSKADDCPVVKNFCHSGCFCMPGFIRKGDICVKPSQCKDCKCEVFGDPHYKTFDGTSYDFQGQCTYVASRDKLLISKNHTYQVLVSNRKCGPAVTCIKEIAILYDGNVIVLNEREANKIITKINGVQINNFPHRGDWIIIENMPNNHITVYIPKIHLEVSFFYRHWKLVIHVSSSLFNGQLEGLCGNCNKDRYDDITTSTGLVTTNYNEFGISWQVTNFTEGMIETETCEETAPAPLLPPPVCKNPGFPLPPKQDPCMLILNSEIFGMCHHLVDPAPYIAACQFDMCYRKNPESLKCDHLSAYAQACQMQGLCLDWRTDELCPYVCPKDWVYKSCGSGCELTCKNHLDFKRDPNYCGLESVEGCFCPEGFARIGRKCVKVEDCKSCVCSAWGDPHHTSFDKRYFDFQGKCTYVASRVKSDDGNYLFQVLVTNEPFFIGVSSLVAITVLYNNHIVYLRKELTSSQITTQIDGNFIAHFPLQSSWINIASDPVNNVIVYIPEINLQVTFIASLLAFEISTPSYGSTLEGLCGNCNGDTKDDFTLRNGTVVENAVDFGINWIVTEVPPGVKVEKECLTPLTIQLPPTSPCQPSAQIIEACSLIMNKTLFGECHDVVNPANYVETCKFDLCRNQIGNLNIQCTGAETYASACRAAGLCLDWRSDDLCPYSCPSGMEYHACSTNCMPATCENDSTDCVREETEGCHCPAGHVLDSRGICVAKGRCSACPRDGCALVTVPEIQTIGMITETDPKHGLCTSNQPTNGYKICSGQCSSSTFFNRETLLVQERASCCKPTSEEAVYFQMTCADGYQYRKTVMAPGSCSCNRCHTECPDKYDIVLS